ncbi:hypothetical protein ACH5RR_037112 [Cinchona calisaya]|uniref:Uncharacterized protein n=1 Tax=Cinchona calisaya TaxID=153742 RepID=A0ABD2Y594_9GENT
MASRQRIYLAMPVLLSRSLDKMAQAPILKQSHASFPMHNVYAWLAHYFSTHYKVPNTLQALMMTNYSREGEARNFNERDPRVLIHLDDWVTWWATSLVKNRNELFVDDGNYRIQNLAT